ncbi:MAG: POTRA domain-containing protein [Thermoguttaceae bacterium]
MAELRTDTGRHITRCAARLLAALALSAAASLACAQMRPESPGPVPTEGGPALTGGAAPVTRIVPTSPQPNPPDSANADPNAPRPVVVDVRVVGNKSLPLTKIQPHIHTRTGRPFDLEMIEEDVRRLERTGMFVDIKTYWQQVPNGRIVYFDVLERPVLQDVLFVGCHEIHKRSLQRESGLKKGDAASPPAIEEARAKLEDYYHKHGFANARVTLFEGSKPEDRRVVFLINEGIKQRVLWTTFVGNTIADDGRLRTQITTSRPFLWLFGGELDRKKVEEDVDKLTAYYRGLGFFRARIGCDLQFNEKQNWVTVSYVIDEGPRYKIRDVSVVGNTKYTTDELMAATKLKSGEYFNQAKMAADQGMLQDKYGSIGYVFADVKADPRFLEEPAQLDLIYNVKEGDRYRVGKVNIVIKGECPHTQLTTVLNRLSLKPGDILNTCKIRDDQRRLRASGLFEANPANGNAPKIVFNPPGRDGIDDEELARKPGGPGGRGPGGPSGGPVSGSPSYRGQSPDPEPRDRVVDVTLDCGRYVGPPPSGSEVSSHRLPSSAGLPAGYAMNGPRPLAADVQDDSLLRKARQYSMALSNSRQEARPRDGLIATQYSPDAGRTNPASSAQWTPVSSSSSTSGDSAASSTNSTGGTTASSPTSNASNYANGQTAPTGSSSQAAPAQPNAAYGQPWPSQAPQRPVETPQGQYLPGPIFSENSPFHDGPPDGDLSRSLPLNVFTEEAMTGRVMFGVGVNSDSGVVGSVILDEQNFDWTRFPTSWEQVRNGTAWRGAGQRFRIEAVPGSSTQRYSIQFDEPYLCNTPISLSLSGYYYERSYTEYTQEQVGGRVALGYQFAPDLSGTVAYRGAKVRILDPIDPYLSDFAEVTGRDLAIHGFSVNLAHDKRDNAFLATEGHLVQASFEQVLGSFTYPHAEIDLRKYFTLYERPDGSGRHVLTLAGRAGVTGGNTPVYERYYAGGFSTIRGFQFRDASPHVYSSYAGENVFIGGDFELFASAEYMFPITADDMIRGVVFCDTGTVEPTISDWSDNYRVAPGFGLRICVPAMGPAPIALDFAFPVSWQSGDRFEVFSFFVGFGR